MNIYEVIQDLKKIEFQLFITKKLALQNIKHKKIVQKIHKTYNKDICLTINITHPYIMNDKSFNKLINFQKKCPYYINININIHKPNHYINELCQNLSKIYSINELKFHIFRQRFSDKMIWNIGLYLQKLKNLRSLNIDFSCNEINYIHSRTILSKIRNLTNLRNLELSIGNNYLGQEYTTIQVNELLDLSLKNVLKFQKLRQLHLDFSDFKLQNSDLYVFQPVFSQFSQQLQKITLNFDNNMISFEGVNFILENINKLENLRYLCLSFSENKLGIQDGKLFVKFDKILTHLKQIEIKFNNNEIQLFQIKSLYHAFANLRNLEQITIQLYENYFLSMTQLQNMKQEIFKSQQDFNNYNNNSLNNLQLQNIKIVNQ